jgi:uncharacterized membrane protein
MYQKQSSSMYQKQSNKYTIWLFAKLTICLCYICYLTVCDAYYWFLKQCIWDKLTYFNRKTDKSRHNIRYTKTVICIKNSQIANLTNSQTLSFTNSQVYWRRTHHVMDKQKRLTGQLFTKTTQTTKERDYSLSKHIFLTTQRYE